MKPEPAVHATVAPALAVDHVAGDRRRGVAAGDGTGSADGPRLGVDGIRRIQPEVFGEINENIAVSSPKG